jgi:hypothetical protein
MKKYFVVASSLAMVLSLGACGSAPASTEPAAEPAAEEEKAEMANPWTQADTAQAAADGAGVGYFNLPENGTVLKEGGPVDFTGFQYTKLLAEADGYAGTAELVVRKGVKRPAEEVSYDTADVSGDLTEYTCSWDMEAAGWQVHCFGNEDGRAMKAIWASDNFSFSIMVRGQGDIADTYGLSGDDIATLVGAIE